MTVAGYTLQPWSEIVWPAMDALPMTTSRALSVPAIARCVQVIESAIRVCPLDAVRGDQVKPRPRVLSRPDPTRGLAWWLGVNVRDYLLEGNALQLVTSRDAYGYPASVAWLPAAHTMMAVDPVTGEPVYWHRGVQLDAQDVMHVRRGADPAYPWRGIGVVEQHLDAAARAKSQEDYESRSLSGSGVPSVVVIAPNADLSQKEADDAKDRWEQQFSGAQRRPAILPAGTEVKPLSWSPTDAQMVEAKKMTLLDMANIFNLDGWWVGASAGSFNYKTPGQMWTGLMRQTTSPIMSDFEDIWSDHLVIQSQRVRFDRKAATRDDFASEIATMDRAVKAGLMTQLEARDYLGLPPIDPAELPTPQATTRPEPDQGDEEIKTND